MNAHLYIPVPITRNRINVTMADKKTINFVPLARDKSGHIYVLNSFRLQNFQSI